MRLRQFLYILVLLSVPASAQTVGSFNAWCIAGGLPVQLTGIASSTLVQASYPKCTVSVFLTGTTSLAPIYSTVTLAPLSNPFTANSDSSFLFFAALTNQYDVVISSNPSQQVIPNVGPSPSFTWRDIAVSGSGSGGGGGGGGGGTVTTVTGASGQICVVNATTTPALSFCNPTVMPFPVSLPAPLFANLTGAGSRCLHVDSTGQLSATSSDCATLTGATVFGRSLPVIAQSGDYTVAQVTGAAPLDSPVFTTKVQVPVTGIAAQCLHVDTTGKITGTGQDCGNAGGGGNVTGTSLTAGQPVLGNTGSAIVVGAINLAGGSSFVTGILPAANQPATDVNAVTNDTNITGSIAAQNLTLGFTGTLAAGRLNSNVVQAITNDTNVTGSIAAQNLTLGWTGTLAKGRIVASAVYNDQTNTYGAGLKQLFTPSATTAGFRHVGVTADPSVPAFGDQWCRSDLSTCEWYDGTAVRTFMQVNNSIALAQTPLTTNGDLLSVSGAALSRLGIGSNGQFLGAVGGAVAYNTNLVDNGPGTTLSYPGAGSFGSLSINGAFSLFSPYQSLNPSPQANTDALALFTDHHWHFSYQGAAFRGGIVDEPATPCTVNQVLATNGSSVWSCASQVSAVPISSLQAAAGSNTVTMSNNVFGLSYSGTPPSALFKITLPASDAGHDPLAYFGGATVTGPLVQISDAASSSGVTRGVLDVEQSASTNPIATFLNGGNGVTVSHTGVIAATGSGHVNADQCNGGTCGTVTSIATTLPITGGTLTSTGTIACPTCISNLASINSGALVASVSTATLCGAPCSSTGTYSVKWSMYQAGAACTTNTTGGVTFLLTWTDANGTVHSAVSVAMQDSLAPTALSQTFHFNQTGNGLGTVYASGDFTMATNGAIIQYATGFSQCSVSGTATYGLSATVTRQQ